MAIARALAERGHPVRAWLIGLDGRWWELPGSMLADPPAAKALDDPARLGASGPLSAAAALEVLAGAQPAPVVFPALHGPFGEDGTLQALVGSAGLVCCGSGVGRICGGHGQAAVQAPVSRAGVAGAALVGHRRRRLARPSPATIERLESFAAGLADPRLVVKPARLGSSIGISIVGRPDEPPELELAVEDALRYGDLALAEPYLDHPRELEVALLGDAASGVEVFGPGEVLPGREFYDYEAKYRSDVSRTLVTPDVATDLAADVRRIAREAFLAIGASGFARVDFLVERSGTPWLSEINTIPGFTPISLFPMLVAAAGHDFGAVCERIVQLALERAAVMRPRLLSRADLP